MTEIADIAKAARTKAGCVPSVTLVRRPNDPDAVAIGELYRKARSSVVDSVRYLIEAGHRLAKKKDKVGHGNWLRWLEANADLLGFETPRTAQRLMDVASKCDASVVFGDNEALAISRQIWGHNVRGTGGTGQNEWFTPAKYIALARQVLGEIDLDPATHETAQATIQAKQFFTKADNGLAQKWHGRVWLNPPYTFVADFVSKMVAERQAGRVSAAIMLTHNYTDTTWFHEAQAAANAICFTRGRVDFYKLDGDIAKPTQGQAFFYFGNDFLTFEARFKEIGFVVPAAAQRRRAQEVAP
jgi:phage N-6-adenine-methyltransferase